MNRIVIVSCPLDVDKNEMFEQCRTDEHLESAIVNYGKELIRNGQEIFEHRDNIIVTESGYYASFYEDELEKVSI